MMVILMISVIANIYFFKISTFETISGGTTKEMEEDIKMEKRGTQMNPGLEEKMKKVAEKIVGIEKENENLRRENNRTRKRIWQLQKSNGVLRGIITNAKKKRSKKRF
jgi:hypothetical protein